MEAELWKQVYKLVTEMAKGKTIKRATYTDADIIQVFLWAVLHDRPVYWACKKSSCHIYYRRRKLPNASTMTRRLRTEQLQDLLKVIENHLIGKLPRHICRRIDGKPLPHWVRTLFRVRLWVRGKTILYHLWRLNHVAKTARR